MGPLDEILSAAGKAPKAIVLAEGEDPRIAAGAARAREAGIARPLLVGRPAVVAEKLSAAGANPGQFEIIDPATSAKAEDYAAAFHALRRHKGVDEAAALKAMLDPLQFAAMMVRQGDAEGSIAGAVATTADTVRAALQIVGRAAGVTTVSSFFLMLLAEAHHPKQGLVVFADCGLVVEPSVEELAQIAISSAGSLGALTGQEARIAMLSFSTAGSAKHDRAVRVAEAAALVASSRPDLTVDGELQFDAAFVPAVAASKAPASPLAGAANVFVFPSLEAGNIGYKIAQRIGGAVAIGPILQGLAKPCNDLSRGCSVEDVFHMLAVTSVQAAAT